MIVKGKLHAETPIYRGNARKTMFTRDGDGKYKLVSLAGEISGTAQALMDAFTGQSRNGKNIGLLDRLWKRLYGSDMPRNLIRKVECKLREECYPKDKFFDLRMGVKLDEDRWAVESTANYKMETLLRNSVFDFTMNLNDGVLKQGDNTEKLYYVLGELKAGRFWFGAGKSKGLGRVRLEGKLPFSAKNDPPALNKTANHLTIDLSFDSENPVLVGWNWGKVDPHTPSFLSLEARLLIDSMKEIPSVIRERLNMSIGGSILNPDEWKKKFSEYFPRSVAIWLKEESEAEIDAWVLTTASLNKLTKGKYALNKKLAAKIRPLADKPFTSKEEASKELKGALGKKAAKMAKRVVKELGQRREVQQSLNRKAWDRIAGSFGLDDELRANVSECIKDEAALTKAVTPACKNVETRLFQQVDQQIKLLQSDAWIDAETQSREEHLKIKTMLMQGKISESQWGDPRNEPEGIRPGAWKEFLKDHRRVAYRHMLNDRNLKKSITNDRNQIEFLKAHRDKTRLELSRPEHIDFREGGPSNRHISKEYGKPYDTIFMRMLSWAPSSKKEGYWEIYIPGGTIKGAFRKRASQLLKTLWGDNRKTAELLDELFGAQRRRGLAFFSDAYLTDPGDTDNSWCSMDGVCMNPRTGQPVETSKRDYLFAYGDKLVFRFRIDLMDIGARNMTAVSLLFHLLDDFKLGEIPLGGEKTSGFGWVQADVAKVLWLTSNDDAIHRKMFGAEPLTQSGAWRAMEKTGEEAEGVLTSIEPILPGDGFTEKIPHEARAGFISHRAFGGCCGRLVVEVEPLTPLAIRESGEPSYTVELSGEPVNGCDFYSISPPETKNRASEGDRVYALPGRSLRGMIRHIYTIAADAHEESPDLSRLNAADSLFGWVGEGPNQAIMGRLAFEFAKFETTDMAWFKAPYPYGEWRHDGEKWRQKTDAQAEMSMISDQWRVFPHAPLAPIIERLDGFAPDAVQARYFRAMLPGSKARFTLRFWNLEKAELERLIWCIELESGLGHKMGNNRYLGFGSVKLSILPESHRIDWSRRYAGKSPGEWRAPLDVDRKTAPRIVKNYSALKKALNVKHL